MKKILIVAADYYESISLSFLKSAKKKLKKYSTNIINLTGVFESDYIF